jgi:hypothetical protein
VYRIMPAALVPRPWDFDLPPGTPDLIPVHENGPLKQVPPRETTGQPSGDLPPVSPHDGLVPTPPWPEPSNPGTGKESLVPPPSVTITPPTLRGLPHAEVQLPA